MSDDSQSRLQRMTIAGIFRQALALYRENVLKLIGIVAPSSITSWAVYLFIFGDQLDIIEPSADSATMPAVFLYGAIVVFLSSIATAAGTIAISERFLERDVTIGQAYLRVIDVLFPLLGSLLLASIAIAAGFVLCFIPGVVAYVWFCLTPAVVMIEGEGGVGALKRSYVTIKGYWNKAFFVVVLLAIIQLIVAMLIFSLPTQLGASVSINVFFKFLSICLPLLIEPFKIATTTILYYDLRIRKEGYTLQIMADEIASSP